MSSPRRERTSAELAARVKEKHLKKELRAEGVLSSNGVKEGHSSGWIRWRSRGPKKQQARKQGSNR